MHFPLNVNAVPFLRHQGAEWQPVDDPYGGGTSATVAASAAPPVARADYPADATAYNQSI